jgi:uncharacterized repeat protein (TIGR01451 family)
VTSAFSEPVNGGAITFAGPLSGAGTNPITATATITAGGAVSRSVTANGTTGSYTVTAGATGVTSVNFALQNIPPVYAKPGGLTSGACDSWANACELRYAITSTVSGQEIWVKAGTYTPGAPGNRTATFQLKIGVAIYGGFAGTEGTRADRNLTTNITILSGDIDNNDTVDVNGIVTTTTAITGSNSYHIVTGVTGATLDGVTITGGNANGNSPNDTGGGMINSSNSPTLTNVTFSGNSAAYGGGMHNYNSSSPTLINVTFSGNLANSYGGGLYNLSSSNPTLINVTFSGNSATSGGGMRNYASSPTLRNSILWGDTGGEIVNDSGSPTITNSVVQGGCPSGSTCANVITTNPLLGALGNYGGSTKTFPLLPGSSAIKATSANCPATDQRGIARGTTCDIGAYESRGFTLTKTSGDNQSAVINTAFTTPLALSVTSAFTEPVNGGQIILTAPSSGASITGPIPITLTIAGGAVSRSVTANGIGGGPYAVTASATGATSVTYNLTNTYLLTIAIVGSGVVTPSVGTYTYPYNTVVPITATAHPGLTFADWSGDLNGSANPTSILINGNKSITATFSLNTYTLTVAVVGDGIVTPSVGTYTYPYNTVVPITATAHPGSTFADWSGACAGTSSCVVTMTADQSVTATFTTIISSLVFTSTVDPTEITRYGPYTITYQTVITNNTGGVISNPALTYTLDSALSLVSLVMDGISDPGLPGSGTVFLSGGTVVLPSGGTVVLANNYITTVLPGGSMVLPDGGTVFLASGYSLYLAPGGTMVLPGGGTVNLDPTISWRASSMSDGSAVTMTLMVQGAALWRSTVTTTLQMFDRPDNIPLVTSIAPTASSSMSVDAGGPTTARQGEIITYTIAFTNVSDLPVYNVWVTDTLPAGVLPLPAVQTTMFVPVAPPAEVFKYRLPVKVMMQGGTLVNRVNVSAIGLRLDPIVGNSATWATVVAGVYKVYLPIGRR